MQTSADLKNLLARIDRRGYPAYKDTRGAYQFPGYVLSIDHVQGDPFAAPSKLSIHVSGKTAGFPRALYETRCRRLALQDELTRQFGRRAAQFSFQAKGSGQSGLISVSRCGPEVLERTACRLDPERGDVLLRLEVGFPANGRTINARELEKILFDYLPACVQQSFYFKNLSEERLHKVIALAEDQEAIRSQLKEKHLVAFVADGAILPRESGISSRPMRDSVAFSSPDSLRVSMELPHKGTITGMGIPEGITLIVGGGYHGKSTLLQALELGVYNHIAGDGREYVITDDTAVKLRAEDGRFIKDADISMFINDLPNKKDTHRFSTEDASGSTSQAAGIVEAMEAGSHVFLLDEDTSATNFMLRDALMQQVVSPDKEPITPFLSRAGELYEKEGISTILVAGSSGAFFHIADTVIQMDNYVPLDITDKAKTLCAKFPVEAEKAKPYVRPESVRIMTKDPNGAKPKRDYRTGAVKGTPERLKVKLLGKDGFALGRQNVDLRYVEQLVDSEQTAALGMLLKYAVEKMIDGKKTIPEIVSYLQKQLETKGLSFFADGGYIPCGYAIPRVQEIYACFNRYRRA